MRRRCEAATLRLQAHGRGLLARWRHRRHVAELGRASPTPGLVRLSVGEVRLSVEEEPAWLREAEELLTGSLGTAKLTEALQTTGRTSGAGRLRSERVRALPPTRLFFPSSPNTPSPSPYPSPPEPRRREGEAWRSGGRQRRLYRDLKSERETDTAAEYQDAVAAACDESRAYADSIRSAAELRERQLYREREEARQLAEAMQQSAAYSGDLDEGQQAAFLTLCDEVGISPADVQWPMQVPRASDRAKELRFARRCRARRISLDGRKERWERKFESIHDARTMAEVVMAERFGIEVRREEYTQGMPA